MERYSRNKLFDLVGEEGQEKLSKAKVLVLGAGGVGSHIIMHLAALGVGNIGIVDNDIVSITNLNRQVLYNTDSIGKYKVHEAKKWIEKFNPHINVNAYSLRLNESNCEEIYKDYDILVDAFDTLTSVEMINNTAVKYNKILVHAWLNEKSSLVMTIIPKKTSCYKCFNNKQKEELPPNAEIGMISPFVSLVANMQVFEVLKIILEKGELFTSKPLIFDGFLGKMIRPQVYTDKKNKCPVCGLPLASLKKI